MKSTISKNIPLSVPNLSGNEWKYIKECLDTNWVSSVGSYVNAFEKKIQEFTGAKYAVATSNGTAALHISLLLAGVQPNDYVIVPNITFIASANSIKYTGADPIFIDIDAQTWQMNLQLLEEFLDQQTVLLNGNRVYKKDNRIVRAIMPVHVLGNICDMNHLQQIAKKNDLPIVEDATEALGSYYKQKHAGTFGQFGCFSFNGNKIITTGGGGMIITDNEKLALKAKHLTTQAKSDPFEYVHDEIGYNYRLVNILAAMGVAQMEQLPSFLETKRRIAEQYYTSLFNVGDIVFQKVAQEVQPNNWLLTVKTGKQKLLLQLLNEQGIQCRPFWVPMNQLQMFKENIYLTKDNVSEKIYASCLSLPCSTNLSEDEVELITAEIKKCY